MTELVVRDATLQDAAPLCELINDIIRIGGTTAHQRVFDEDSFLDHYLHGSQVMSCVVAVGAQGGLLGFQVISKHTLLPSGWGDIGTFARVSSTQKGVGTALFAVSRPKAIAMGLSWLNATIRADNVGGQAYYAKMGFEFYHTEKAVPLCDGTLVDKISRRLKLV